MREGSDRAELETPRSPPGLLLFQPHLQDAMLVKASQYLLYLRTHLALRSMGYLLHDRHPTAITPGSPGNPNGLSFVACHRAIRVISRAGFHPGV